MLLCECLPIPKGPRIEVLGRIIPGSPHLQGDPWEPRKARYGYFSNCQRKGGAVRPHRGNLELQESQRENQEERGFEWLRLEWMEHRNVVGSPLAGMHLEVQLCCRHPTQPSTSLSSVECNCCTVFCTGWACDTRSETWGTPGALPVRRGRGKEEGALKLKCDSAIDYLYCIVCLHFMYFNL